MSADVLDRTPQGAPPQTAPDKPTGFTDKAWAATWPKLLAVGIAIALWQLVVWSGWKPDYLLPGPGTALATTLRRGVFGFAIALVIGSLLGIAVSQWRVLRAGVGSMITGLQTMPSVAWFPLALLLFGLTESAITFVIVLGAAPSIANGIIGGIDEVPPTLLRAGHTLGARGLDRYRYVVLPAALPSYVSGLKQGWAFSWRSLLAGELLVQVPGVVALGSDMSNARNNAQPELLLALIVILVIGMVVDSIFSALAQ
ncbi:MAG: ABC transporter permease, partial [Nocardioidaceae bacterium]|nr:ABC transporter permease [Nocardioidaceae bacterium]